MEEEESLDPYKFEIQIGKLEKGSSPRQDSLYFPALPMGLHFCPQSPQSHPFLFTESSIFPACRVWGSDSLLSLYPLFVPFSSNWQCCCSKIFKSLWDYHMCPPLDKRLLQRSCLDIPVSIFGFSLEAEGI